MATVHGQAPDTGYLPSVFEPDAEARQRMAEAYRQGIRSVRNILFLVAAMTALFEVLAHWRLWRTLPDATVVVTAGLQLVVVAAYVALGFRAGKRPFTALMVGLALYLVLFIGRVLMAHSYSGSALLARGMVIALFISGLRKARQLQRLHNAI